MFLHHYTVRIIYIILEICGVVKTYVTQTHKYTSSDQDCSHTGRPRITISTKDHYIIVTRKQNRGLITKTSLKSTHK